MASVEGGQVMSDYCGCCGNEIDGEALWCERCQPHVGQVGHLWNRTYFARTGEDCPFAVATDPCPPHGIRRPDLRLIGSEQ